MEKLIQAISGRVPRLTAKSSFSIQGVLLMAFGWVTTDDSLPKEWKVIGVIVIVVMASLVHISTALSNPNGTDASESYEKE